MWRRGNPSTLSWNINWYNHYGEQYGGSFKNIEIELLFDSVIPLLAIYPEKIIIQKDTCTAKFIAALLTNSQDMETT